MIEISIPVAIFIMSGVLGIIGFFLNRYIRSIDGKLTKIDDLALQVKGLSDGLTTNSAEIINLKTAFEFQSKNTNEKFDKQQELIINNMQSITRHSERINNLYEKIEDLEECQKEITKK